MKQASEENAVVCCGVGKTFALVGKDTAKSMLKADDSALTFYQALQDVSFSIPAGTFVGVLGHNGAGKSTLLRVLGEIYQPTEGEIERTGETRGIYELGIGGNKLMTGRRFVKRWLKLNGISQSDQVQSIIKDIQNFSELGVYFDKKILTYSTGMRARLFFGTITALPGKIYLIDELLSVGDLYFNAKSWRRIRDKIAAGASGVLATHDWTAILKLCETAFCLKGGKIVDRGEPMEVVRNYLELPPPPRDVGLIHLPEKKKFFAMAGQDFTFEVEVEVKSDSNDLYLFMSVERFQEKFGWEHILQLEYVPIGKKVGVHTVEVTVPKLPLAAGEYIINLSLSKKADAAGTTMEPIDDCTWMRDNYLMIEVSSAVGQEHQAYPIGLEWVIE